MKKIFVLLIGLISITAVFAQSGYDRSNECNGYHQSGDEHGRNYSGDYQHNDRYNYPSQQNYPDYNDSRRRRQDERYRGYNNRRSDEYRNYRSTDPYQEDTRFRENNNRRRQGNFGSFAGGAVVGAVAGVLLGSILRH